MSFADLGLGPETLRAIEDVGYATPTPIQAQAIPFVLMGRDVLGLAQTGTGKTASFTLPMIEILAAGRARARMPRSLILTPTRELAAQVAENFTLYGKYHKLSMALLVGGESMTDQVRLLDRGVDVLIATPGRLLDLFQRGRILLTDVKVFVIDEADRMLDMGFIPDVERIAQTLPKRRQTLFFSATMPPEVKRLADAFLDDPKEVRVAPPAAPSATVTQGIVVVQPSEKRDALRALLRSENVKNAFIFCNRKRDISTLHRSLVSHGFSVAMLHGDMPQSLRTETLERFKAGETSLMVCSDVAARGLDVSAMSHVFNFDVPIHAEDYIHRIGRTGRAGLEGRAFTIATPEESRHVAAIVKLLGKEIPRVMINGMEDGVLDAEETSGGGRERGRERGRGRGGRSPRRGEAPPPSLPAEEVAPAPVAASVPVREEAPPPRAQREPRRDRSPSSSEARHGRPSRRSMRDDGTGVGSMEHADDVLGFGDHLPDFFLIDPVFAPMEKGGSAERADADDVPFAEVEAEVEVRVEGETKPRSRRKPSARKAAPKRGAPQEDTEASAPEIAASETTASEDSVPEAPAKPKRTRAAKPKAPKAAKPEASGGTTPEASGVNGDGGARKAPSRSRKKKVEAVAEDGGGGEPAHAQPDAVPDSGLVSG